MPETQPNITPVILAGGAGRRLRPLSGPSRPKPFLRVFGGQSLLQQAALRVDVFQAPIIVTSKAYGQRALEDLCEIDMQPSKIILEPCARSTAPAIAMAALEVGVDDIMLVMPSDHYVADNQVFQAAVMRAAKMAQDGGVVMIGARASKPSNRYGYIQCAQDGAVERFVEKPNAAQARVLLREGGVFWNTGVFAASGATLLEMFAQHAPEILAACRAAHEAAMRSGIFCEPDYMAFSQSPSEAIDRAIMEKVSGARLVALEARWSDVGVWSELLSVKFGTLFNR